MISAQYPRKIMSTALPNRRVAAALLALALIASACTSGETSNDAASQPDDSTSETIDDVGSAEDGGDGNGRDVTEPTQPNEPAALGAEFTKLTEPGVGGRITSIAFDPDNDDRLFVGGDLLGIAVTDDFGDTWQSTTGLANWEIGDITATPAADGRIWTGSLSGPQSSTDGLAWELSRNGMPATSQSTYTLAVESVLIDPNNNSRLVAFNGNQRDWDAPGAVRDGVWSGDGSVWESTDAGNNWSQLSVVAPGGNNRAAAFNSDGSLVYAAVANRGVFVSTDGGQAWTESPDGLPHANAYDITTHPTDPLTAWVAMGEGPEVGGDFIAGGIWKTTDGGATWQPSNDGLTIISNSTAGNTGSFHQIVVAPSDPDRLYTSNVAPGQAAIYRSDDGGASWSIIADGATPRPNPYEGALRAFDIAVHPSDADRLAIGSDDTLLGSLDGGGEWTDLTTIEGNAGFFSGHGYSGLVTTDIVFNPNDPEDTILLGFDGGNFIQTIDGGLTWRRTVQDVSAWGGGVEAAYSPTQEDVIYVLLGQFRNFRGIGVSTNGGASFRLSVGESAGLPEVANTEDPIGASGLAVLENGDSDIVFATVGGVLYRSDDSASTFSEIGGLDRARDVAVTPDGTVFVATDSGVLSSSDLGLGFNSVDGSPVGITTLYTSETEPGTIYGVEFRDGEGGAYTWDGNAWTRLFEDEYAHGIAVDPENANNIAIVTTEQPFNDISSATGVYLSDDGGASWTVVTDGLPMLRLRTAEFDPANPDRLVVGTTGRGFYEISFEQAMSQ